MQKELIDIKKKMLDVAFVQQEGHLPSSFSIMDIIYVLYKEVLQDQDVFILSKGHACLGYYAVLNHLGYISDYEYASFCNFDSKLGGHPRRNKDMGILASTGSLGHGLPIAIGYALANKQKGKTSRVFCLVGDGEINEGTFWESMVFLENNNLDITVIVDYNKTTIDKDVLNKLLGFYCEFIDTDGHDHEQLKYYLQLGCNLPRIILAYTIKGYGSPKLEVDNSYHHRSPKTIDELNMLKEELYA